MRIAYSQFLHGTTRTGKISANIYLTLNPDLIGLQLSLVGTWVTLNTTRPSSLPWVLALEIDPPFSFCLV